jgi:hypothetical protein
MRAAGGDYGATLAGVTRAGTQRAVELEKWMACRILIAKGPGTGVHSKHQLIHQQFEHCLFLAAS